MLLLEKWIKVSKQMKIELTCLDAWNSSMFLKHCLQSSDSSDISISLFHNSVLHVSHDRAILWLNIASGTFVTVATDLELMMLGINLF